MTPMPTYSLSADLAGHFGIPVAESAPEPEWLSSTSYSQPRLDSSDITTLGHDMPTSSTYTQHIVESRSPLYIPEEDRVGSNIDPNDPKIWWQDGCDVRVGEFVAAPLTGGDVVVGELDLANLPVQVSSLKRKL